MELRSYWWYPRKSYSNWITVSLACTVIMKRFAFPKHFDLQQTVWSPSHKNIYLNLALRHELKDCFTIIFAVFVYIRLLKWCPWRKVKVNFKHFKDIGGCCTTTDKILISSMFINPAQSKENFMVNQYINMNNANQNTMKLSVPNTPWRQTSSQFWNYWR
jgi:hypothetical protein